MRATGGRGGAGGGHLRGHVGGVDGRVGSRPGGGIDTLDVEPLPRRAAPSAWSWRTGRDSPRGRAAAGAPRRETLPAWPTAPTTSAYIDADKTGSPGYLEHAVRLVRPGRPGGGRQRLLGRGGWAAPAGGGREPNAQALAEFTADRPVPPAASHGRGHRGRRHHPQRGALTGGPGPTFLHNPVEVYRLYGSDALEASARRRAPPHAPNQGAPGRAVPRRACPRPAVACPPSPPSSRSAPAPGSARLRRRARARTLSADRLLDAQAGLRKAFRPSSAGRDVDIQQSYGASGEQSRAVQSGLPADVAAASRSSPTSAAVRRRRPRRAELEVLAHPLDGHGLGRRAGRPPGNPKKIRACKSDLLKPGLQIVLPTRATSGRGARWN